MAVVAGVAVGGLGVAALVRGAQVEIIVFMGFQLPDDGFTGDAYGSHVVGAALHLGFHRVEGVLGVKDGHVAGRTADGDLISRNRKRQRTEHQHHCQE